MYSAWAGLGPEASWEEEYLWPLSWPPPVRQRWLGSACSQTTAASHTPPTTAVGAASWGCRPFRWEAPAFQLSQGLGQWTCSC